ncbi:Gfo/Idh/MocA family oxidoreductase [Hoyosella sp. YIM 151337]|uniref:Gfo/Idh/MocA family protein n=1 Tax=Hoyosella sp. YIM 151337 TaxID=2992742 RepID=UPI0022369A36|nr:Gfo/Idh/MocA family oxidoreductase [Hoyosella sp. YIM 151337]MCW4352449.1 Gfo/Idh/MocA family oxidoreductase [Hoyosella sp. YIM 151337]
MTLRVAVLGVGLMGTYHAETLANRTSGVAVTVINDFSPERAQEVAHSTGARVVSDPLEAIAADDVDAVVIATPGPAHEKQVLACLETGKPVLCEKPLTTDAESSLAIVKAEAELGKQLIQVGFMRRYDHEYAHLRGVVESGELGAPLLLHCAHRNKATHPHFDSEMVVKDALVHEVDVTRFLFGEEITAVRILTPAPVSTSHENLRDPQFAIFETESGRMVDVEVFVNTGIAYEVRTEAVFERGSVQIGLGMGAVHKTAPGVWGGPVTADFRERFDQAYASQLQAWADQSRKAIASGNYVVNGPRAWDGYAAAVVCEAGVRALNSGERVAIELPERASIPGA